MFAVIYRGWVLEDKESDYLKFWHIVATYFVPFYAELNQYSDPIYRCHLCQQQFCQRF